MCDSGGLHWLAHGLARHDESGWCWLFTKRLAPCFGHCCGCSASWLRFGCICTTVCGWGDWRRLVASACRIATRAKAHQPENGVNMLSDAEKREALMAGRRQKCVPHSTCVRTGVHARQYRVRLLRLSLIFSIPRRCRCPHSTSRFCRTLSPCSLAASLFSLFLSRSWSLSHARLSLSTRPLNEDGSEYETQIAALKEMGFATEGAVRSMLASCPSTACVGRAGGGRARRLGANQLHHVGVHWKDCPTFRPR